MALKEKEIIEGNRLILESPFHATEYPKPSKNMSKDYFLEVLKFHKQYNWIMPVVEKIEGVFHKGFPINVQVSGSGAWISINNSNAAGEKYEGMTLITETWNVNYFHDTPNDIDRLSKVEGIWLAVVNFIKWYNTQPK